MRSLGAAICIALLSVLLVAGCGSGGREEQGSGTGEGSSGSEARQETGSSASADGETTSEAETFEEDEVPEASFTAAPEASGGSEGAADGIREVTFERREGYERAVVVFGSGGGLAAGVPVWSLSSPEGEGYARITFPDLGVTLDSEGGFGGSILDNFYVVRAPGGGGLFVDLYATGRSNTGWPSSRSRGAWSSTTAPRTSS